MCVLGSIPRAGGLAVGVQVVEVQSSPVDEVKRIGHLREKQHESILEREIYSKKFKHESILEREIYSKKFKHESILEGVIYSKKFKHESILEGVIYSKKFKHESAWLTLCGQD